MAHDTSVVNFNGANTSTELISTDSAVIHINSKDKNGDEDVFLAEGNSQVFVNPGAEVSSAQAFNSAYVAINGDSFSTDLYDNASALIAGGEHNRIRVFGNNALEYTGGHTVGLDTGGGFIGLPFTSSTSNIQGGTIDSILNGEASIVNIYGGTIGEVYTFENSITNIYGGSISQNTLFAKDSGVVNLYGVGFALSGIVGTGADSNGSYNIYNLSGTLQDGTPLLTTFHDYTGGNEIGGADSPLIFHAAVVVPEAGTLSLVLLAGLPIGAGLAQRRRKHSA